MNIGDIAVNLKGLVGIDISTDAGDPAQVDGALYFEAPNGEAVDCVEAAAEDLVGTDFERGVWVSVLTDVPLGEIVISVTADADLGSGVKTISDSFSFTSTGLQASHLAFGLVKTVPK